MASSSKRGVIVECSFCLCTFRDPRLLPCGHTFCLHCLGQLILTTTTEAAQNHNGAYLCPLCRASWKVPHGGVSALPKNYCVADIEHDPEPDISDRSNKRCPCEANERRGWLCLDCHRQLCDVCYVLHLTNESTKSHSLVTLMASDNPMHHSDKAKTKVGSSDSQSLARCLTHTDEKLTLYCVKCAQAVCSICYVTSHFKHEAVELKTVDEQITKELAELRHDLTKKFQQCEERHSCLQNTLHFYVDQEERLRREVRERKENAQRQLRDAVREMELCLKQEEEGSLQLIGTKLTHERQNIQLDLSKSEAYSRALSCIIDQCSKHMTGCSVASKLNAKQSVQQQMKTLIVAENEESVPRKTFAISEFVMPYNVSFSSLSCRELYSMEKLHGQLSIPDLQGPVNILHVYDDLLLAATFGQNRLFLCFLPTNSVQVIVTLANVRDAVLVAGGEGRWVNVVYSMDNNHVAVGALNVGVSGLQDISSTSLPQPIGLSVDKNGSIYAANWNSGVYRSCDGARSWHLYLSPAHCSMCWRVVHIQPPSDIAADARNSSTVALTDFLWAQTYDVLQLIQVTGSNRFSQNNSNESTSIAVRVITNDETVNLGSMAYNNQDCVFVSDRRRKCVMLFSTSGICHGDLISAYDGLKCPWALAFDAAQSVLFVGDANGCINAFKLNAKQRAIFKLSMD